MVPGQIDVKVFNNLYTQTAFYDGSGRRVGTSTRDTYFTSIIALTFGYKPRINLGIDFYPKAVLQASTGSSPFSVLQFPSNQQARTALAAIAPKVKFTPFARVPGLAMQASLYLPVSDDLEGADSGKPFLDYDDWQLWVQGFYDARINPEFLVYLEGGLFFRNDTAPVQPAHEFVFPMKAILNYYPTQRVTVYGLAEVTPATNNQFSSLYTQTGVGLKFQVTRGFEVETLATIFPLGVNKGAGQTYNFGFRYVR